MKSFIDQARITPELAAHAIDASSPSIEPNCTALSGTNPGPNTSLDARQTCSARRILVVDDDTTIRNLLAEVLNRAGYHAQSAANGEQGWTAICAEPFDLLITDHEMPKLCGLDLLRRVRHDGNKMPTILISGAVPWDAIDLPVLLEPGAAIEKPFPLPVILEKIRSLISQAEVPTTEDGEFVSATFRPTGLPLWNAVIANTHL